MLGLLSYSLSLCCVQFIHYFITVIFINISSSLWFLRQIRWLNEFPSIHDYLYIFSSQQSKQFIWIYCFHHYWVRLSLFPFCLHLPFSPCFLSNFLVSFRSFFNSTTDVDVLRVYSWPFSFLLVYVTKTNRISHTDWANRDLLVLKAFYAFWASIGISSR